MSNFTRMEFKAADGTTLRGNFFKAEGKNRPIAILAEGLTLLKEGFSVVFAEAFLSIGISSFIYDPRGFGSSDGAPRHETNPWQQAEDMHAAISAVLEFPDVDPARIVLWGIGHGAVATAVAGFDPRLKLVVIQAMPSAALDVKSFPQGILEKAWADREKKVRDGSSEPTYVQLWPGSIENAQGEGEQTWMHGEAAYGLVTAAIARATVAGTPWENKITLSSFRHIAKTEAHPYLGRIKAPLLYVAVEGDAFSSSIDYHREMFKSAGDNAEFKVVQPPMTAESFEEWLGPSVDAHVEFLQRSL